MGKKIGDLLKYSVYDQALSLLFGPLKRSIKYSSQVPAKLFNSLAGVVPRLEFHHARLTDQQVSTSIVNAFRGTL